MLQITYASVICMGPGCKHMHTLSWLIYSRKNRTQFQNYCESTEEYKKGVRIYVAIYLIVHHCMACTIGNTHLNHVERETQKTESICISRAVKMKSTKVHPRRCIMRVYHAHEKHACAYTRNMHGKMADCTVRSDVKI